jgi:hypothetical protein
MIIPPMEGPRAAARAPTELQIAIAAARFVCGNSFRTNAREAGKRRAPPIACNTRAPISAASVGAAPQRPDEMLKMARPTKKTRRRPTRSASLPDGTRSAAKTIV